MNKHIKSLLQYALILGITVFLVAFSLRSLTDAGGEGKWDYLVETWEKADKGWLLTMAVLAMISHGIRAERWKMLIQPSGYTTTWGKSFLSIMVGYLVNLVIPRGGEVSRCFNLYKLDKVPVDISFGTVVVERVIDLMFLLTMVLLAFLMESDRLFAYMDTLPIHWAEQGRRAVWAIPFLLFCALIVALIFYFLKRNAKAKEVMARTWNGIKKGLLTVFQLRNKGLFIFYSVLIWVLYFMMSYAVIRAFPTTSGLGFSAVFTLFGIGSIAMAIPLPGGTGSYHVLVPRGLSFLYNVPMSEAVAFTFIFHGWQTLIMVAGGAISLVITTIIARKKP